ncbi:MAG: carbon-nitrogen hydrolase [Deltaproteobacteria bacterium]|nr:carbon-nitrogen hydrolase [Deltaproteobacteria bacterium]
MAAAKERVVRIALVQMRCHEEPERNLETALARIAEAAEEKARIVCLPELFRSRYFCQSEDHAHFDLAEPVPGPTTDAIAEAARKHGIAIVTPLFERRAAGIYHNTACVVESDGSLAGMYRKMHIPDDPLYYEKFYFTPGDLGFRAFPTSAGNVGVLICWDQWFPEAARLTALQGAEILFYPTAIGWHDAEKEQYGRGQYEAWQLAQRAHAVANGIFVAAPNRVGREGTVEFWGGSFVAGPFGEIVASASHDREEILVVDCDLGRVEEVRRHWPFLRDRRIDAYQGITRQLID